MEIFKKMSKWGSFAAEKVSGLVGSWLFVFLYTGSMVGWIALHRAGILHIDSPDFMRFNLWLSYFAGTQASILLMAANRQSASDRRKMENTLTIAKENRNEISKVNRRVMALVGLLNEMIEEVNDKKAKK